MLITANMHPLDAAIVVGNPTMRIRPAAAPFLSSGVVIGRTSPVQ